MDNSTIAEILSRLKDWRDNGFEDLDGKVIKISERVHDLAVQELEKLNGDLPDCVYPWEDGSVQMEFYCYKLIDISERFGAKLIMTTMPPKGSVIDL